MKIDKLAVNNLRVLSNSMITHAGSGHPGIALGAAPILYSLYANIMNYNYKNPNYFNRDRFVLSAGHGSALLYATLHAFGFPISKENLKNFRKINSNLPGHPETKLTPGVDCSTGPLGQGVACAVGMAIAEKHLKEKYNKIDAHLLDNKIYCLASDGDMMEGITYEACSVAGNMQLDNLIVIYDRNKKTIDGSTELTFTENVAKRFRSQQWKVIKVRDGNSVEKITLALLFAKKTINKPTLVIVNTIIGYGSDFSNNEKIHGKPLSVAQSEKLKQNLKIEVNDFELLPEVKEHLEKKANKRLQNCLKHRQIEDKYSKKYQGDYLNFINDFSNKIKYEAIEGLKSLKMNLTGSTRELNHVVLNELGKNQKNLIGGTADVIHSTYAFLDDEQSLNYEHYIGRNIHYGVREHAMAGISNGISLYGGLLSFVSCFLSFYDYLKPSLRMSAFMNLPVLYLFSHDSIYVGQDGPTHQPIEQLSSLRTTPNMFVFRPYNMREIVAAYMTFLQELKPTAIIFGKEIITTENSKLSDCLKGGYILQKAEKPANISLVSTGFDVDLAIRISNKLKEENIFANVVSMPCLKIFEKQSQNYQNSVLSTKIPSFVVEAGNEDTWYKLIKNNGLVFGINTFGTSGAGEDVAKSLNFTLEVIVKKIKEYLSK